MFKHFSRVISSETNETLVWPCFRGFWITVRYTTKKIFISTSYLEFVFKKKFTKENLIVLL